MQLHVGREPGLSGFLVRPNADTDHEAIPARTIAPSNKLFGRRKAMAIRPPPAWGWDVISHALHPSSDMLRPNEDRADAEQVRTVPEVRRIGLDDLRDALVRGFDDLGAFRTDVIFLCLVYPVAGLLLARLASGHHLLPLVFPLAAGFALIGPFASVGLNEMSRRREQNLSTNWADNFAVLRSPALGQIVALGFALLILFAVWLMCAQGIYDVTLGPKAPASIRVFIGEVFGTPAGWAMIVIGMSVGLLFALLVLTTTVVAFPMMLDRNVRIDIAIRTSAQVFMANKRTMVAWGLMVATLLVIGSIPALLGLIIVMPVLGHATWYVYRAAVPH